MFSLLPKISATLALRARPRPRKPRPAVLIFVLVLPSLATAESRTRLTIDDLVERVQISTVSVSPDGTRVAYLSVKALPREDAYEIELRLASTNCQRCSVLLDGYRLSPAAAFEPDTGTLNRTAGQFLWRTDSGQLAYTTHRRSGTEVRIRRIRDGEEKAILQGFREIAITSMPARDSESFRIETVQEPGKNQRLSALPPDLGLLVKDGYRFYGPLLNPKVHGKSLTQDWECDWKSIKKVGDARLEVRGFPEAWEEVKPEAGNEKQGNNEGRNDSDTVTNSRSEFRSPTGDWAATVEDSDINLRDPEGARRRTRILLSDVRTPEAKPQILNNSDDPLAFITVLGWRNDGAEFYYLSEGSQYSFIYAVTRDGHTRDVYRDEAGLVAPSATAELSRDGRIAVLVRSTNTMPDELVEVDLRTGSSKVLHSPNERFGTANPASVRFVRIDCCGGEFYGRLYLPKDYNPQTKLPLVFTNYLSTPGFYASVGDEVPILLLVEHGIAVFTLNSRNANIISRTGDFRFEIERLAKPLHALEWVRDHFATDGIIDPQRCGLTGVSYGAEIAMYAYWRSRMFRAISVSTGGWEPMNYFLAGVNFSKFLDSRGLSLSDSAAYGNWKQLSASLNLQADMPPLLLQSPDQEEYFGNVELWLRLKRGGLPVEWVLYPDEGHVKRSPADRWWVYQRNLDWFRFWLKDEQDPDPAKREQYTRWQQMKRQLEITAKRENQQQAQ